MVEPVRHRLVPLALVVAVIAVCCAAPLFKRAQPTHPLISAGFRLVIAATALAPLTVRAAAAGRLRGRSLRLAVLAGLAYGLHFGAWVSSLTMTSVAASVTLVTTTPLLLASVGLVTGRDRPALRLWLALAVAALGLGIIGGGDLLSVQALWGDALAILGAIGMACYLLLGSQIGAGLEVGAWSGVATAVGGLSLLGTAALLGIPLRAASAEAMTFIVLAALVPQLIGHNLLTWSVRHASPSIVGMATVAEPVGATLIAWLWLGESVTPATAVGCVLTLTAVVVALRRPPSRQR